MDTHTDTHTACLQDRLGRQVATITVPADPRGYAKLLAWPASRHLGHDWCERWKGTRSHGLGLMRALQDSGHPVLEAGRPARAGRLRSPGSLSRKFSRRVYPDESEE